MNFPSHKTFFFAFFLLSFFTIAAENQPPAIPNGQVVPGLEVFQSHYLKIVKGKKVGLLCNHSSINRKGNNIIDLMVKDPRVQVTALFAAEHGLRGHLGAGEEIHNGIDKRTKLPVFSLYNSDDRKPQRVELDMVDVIICDLQDSGCRSYTYIWTLMEAIRTCGNYGKQVIVLDRPNPLGGKVVDGPGVADDLRSFLGLYSIPRIYGLTIGELALYINSEYRLNCHLTVIPMYNYRRDMSYNQTGLPWVNPSPNIRNMNQLGSFAITGTIGTIGGKVIGIGGERGRLFESITAPWINAQDFANHMNKLKLPGIRFLPYQQMDKKNNLVKGVELKITEPSKLFPVMTEMYLLEYLKRKAPTKRLFYPDRYASYDKAMGRSYVRQMIMRNYSAKQIIGNWQKERQSFIERRKKYLIYK